jgi:AAA domain, putative AbiEii toxin, Type IV TA system
MLEWLRLENIGPAPEFELNFAPRVNLITGDNGLGKSFLLDVAWFALTGTWRDVVRPQSPQGKPAIIKSKVADQTTTQESVFNPREQTWSRRSSRTWDLVVGIQIDGGFSLWDPMRTDAKMNAIMGRDMGFVFSKNEIWDGLRSDNRIISNGLIQDWANWQREDNDAYKQLKAALLKLSPDEIELLEPGKLTRIGLDDVRDIPTIKMPYGQEIPIVYASAGIRRITALSYALVWTWQEHLRACEITGEAPAKSLVVLIDELEEHLHPRWQRVILPALLETVRALTKQHDLDVQIIATTHSPMVMASLEPLFDPEKDAWFDLNLVDGKVTLEKMASYRQGDANAWLQSAAFDLSGTGSIQVDEVKDRAAKVLENSRFTKKKFLELDRELRTLLTDTDEFWIRWRFVGQKKGWL